MAENPDFKVTESEASLHLHEDGRPKMLHEASTHEERMAIIYATKTSVISQVAKQAMTTVQMSKLPC